MCPCVPPLFSEGDLSPPNVVRLEFFPYPVYLSLLTRVSLGIDKGLKFLNEP